MSSAMRIRRSLFDRLLGAHQDVPEGVMPTYSLDQLRNAVAADLECLLNTRTALHFTVRALLVVSPLKEGVSFDAVLVPAASRYHVTQSRFVSAA